MKARAAHARRAPRRLKALGTVPVLLLLGCASDAPTETRLAARTAPSVGANTHAIDVLPADSARIPNRPILEPVKRMSSDPSAAPLGTPSVADSATPPACEPRDPPAGYQDCDPIEVVGGPPCELECWRDRKVARASKDECCGTPVHGAIFGEKGALVEADACAHVSPGCADTLISKSTQLGFHFYPDSEPPEVLLVQGGCESRAMGHGYVPSVVAAWTGCPVAKRFRWNGKRFDVVR